MGVFFVGVTFVMIVDVVCAFQEGKPCGSIHDSVSTVQSIL